MASPSIRPHMLVADEQGNIYDHPDFCFCAAGARNGACPVRMN